jgi:hypothetical protein
MTFSIRKWIFWNRGFNKLEFNQLKNQDHETEKSKFSYRIQEPTPKWFKNLLEILDWLCRQLAVFSWLLGGSSCNSCFRWWVFAFGRFHHRAVSQTAISSEEYGEKTENRGNSAKIHLCVRKIAFIRRLSSTKIIQAGSKTGFIICFHRFAPFLIKGRNMYALCCS